MQTSLTKLKWLGVAGPAALLGIASVIAHVIYPEVLETTIGLLAVVGVIVVLAFVFSQVIFGLVHRLEERIVDQNRELEALGEVADTLSRTLELQDALQLSLDSTMAAIGASAGVICILDREAAELYSAAHRGLSPAVLEHVRRQKIAEGSLEAEVVFNGRPVVINNAFDDPRTLEICRREGYHSTISVPLKHQGAAVGVLALASTAEGAFGETDVRLLEAIGEQVGIAIEKATLFRDLTQTNRNLATLNSLSDALSTTLELEEVIDRALHAVLASIDAEVAQMWLLEGGAVTSAQVATRGDAVAKAVDPRISSNETCLVISDQQPRFSNDGGCCPGCPQIAPDGANRLRTVGCIPLKSGTDLVGVLRLYGGNNEVLTERQREVLHGAAAQIGVAIKNAQLYEQVQELSILEERDRIAREMHDGLAQVLGYVNTKAFAVRKLLARGNVAEAEKYLAELEEAARDVYADVREGVLGLRTAVRKEGLAASLCGYLEKYSRLSGVQVACDLGGEIDRLSLPASAELQVIRIIQEALSNVRKHARASDAAVTLRGENGSLLVLVEDRGHGFNIDRAARDGRPRFGLQTMRERAESVGGTFQIGSQPGAGTTVRVSIPLGDGRDASQRLLRATAGARGVSAIRSGLDDQPLKD